MLVLITGASGRLAGVVDRTLRARKYTVTALDRAALDITHSRQVADVMKDLRPAVVINCSAYNDVDGAETNVRTAFSVNGVGPAVLADAALMFGTTLVHYSSDFVFDGKTAAPYAEDVPPSPLSTYGVSKLAGEVAVRRVPRHYILRVASLFGGTGTHGHRATVDYFAESMLLGRPVRAALDRMVSPSYADDVALATALLLERRAAFGIYHCINSGLDSWYGVAAEIAKALGISPIIEPVRATEFKSAAARPQFCALADRKLGTVGIQMPAWQSAVRRHITAVYSHRDSATPIAAMVV
jgi:dTDP-4-dehydrorhamnose reductase